MCVNISYKFHRIPDTQPHFITKVHDLLGQPSYMYELIFLNVVVFCKYLSYLQVRFSTLNCDLIHVEEDVCVRACVCVCVCVCTRVTYNLAPDKRTRFVRYVILQAKQDCIEALT